MINNTTSQSKKNQFLSFLTIFCLFNFSIQSAEENIVEQSLEELKNKIDKMNLITTKEQAARIFKELNAEIPYENVINYQMNKQENEILKDHKLSKEENFESVIQDTGNGSREIKYEQFEYKPLEVEYEFNEENTNQFAHPSQGQHEEINHFFIEKEKSLHKSNASNKSKKLDHSSNHENNIYETELNTSNEINYEGELSKEMKYQYEISEHNVDAGSETDSKKKVKHYTNLIDLEVKQVVRKKKLYIKMKI